MAGNAHFLIPSSAPTSVSCSHVSPLSNETAVWALPSAARYPKYAVPSVAIATDGSQVWSSPRLVEVGIGRTLHVSPLSSETMTAWLPLSCSGRLPPHPLLGTYTVPSPPTLR